MKITFKSVDDQPDPTFDVSDQLEQAMKYLHKAGAKVSWQTSQKKLSTPNDRWLYREIKEFYKANLEDIDSGRENPLVARHITNLILLYSAVTKPNEPQDDFETLYKRIDFSLPFEDFVETDYLGVPTSLGTQPQYGFSTQPQDGSKISGRSLDPDWLKDDTLKYDDDTFPRAYNGLRKAGKPVQNGSTLGEESCFDGIFDGIKEKLGLIFQDLWDYGIFIQGVKAVCNALIWLGHKFHNIAYAPSKMISNASDCDQYSIYKDQDLPTVQVINDDNNNHHHSVFRKDSLDSNQSNDSSTNTSPYYPYFRSEKEPYLIKVKLFGCTVYDATEEEPCFYPQYQYSS